MNNAENQMNWKLQYENAKAQLAEKEALANHWCDMHTVALKRAREAEAKLAEKEARIEELTDEHTELCGKAEVEWKKRIAAEAKLAALVSAGDDIYEKLHSFTDQLDSSDFNALSAWDAAKSGAQVTDVAEQIAKLKKALAPFADLLSGNMEEVGGGTLFAPTIKVQMVKDAKDALMEGAQVPTIPAEESHAEFARQVAEFDAKPDLANTLAFGPNSAFAPVAMEHFYATILRQVGCPIDTDTDAIAAWRDEAVRRNKAQVPDVAELMRDKARKEWLIKECARVTRDPAGYFIYWGDTDGTNGEWQTERYETPDAAIDAAMEGGK